ncbi:MAG: C13 family peptidase [Pseudomonadota bacterium]|nr:C13 family peptidase [Pseudomonadota bacterium]
MTDLRGWGLAVIAALASPASGQYRPPAHTQQAPLLANATVGEIAMLAELGTSIERNRSATEELTEHRRLATALAQLKPGRPGVIEAFVVTVALDSDLVFGREAREAGRVLTRRYAASGHSLVLAGSDGNAPSALPMGSPANIEIALARVAELMGKEDVLVLYTTSHGAPFGVVYNDGDQGFGAISPTRLWSILQQLGIENRLLLISACYAGVFVPMLASDTTAILTASAADRTSFGCRADSDWTFFGDAMINHALRQPRPLATAAAEAGTLIGGWESRGGLTPSQPQVSIGAKTTWLAALEAHLPAATPMVGRPAVSALHLP